MKLFCKISTTTEKLRHTEVDGIELKKFYQVIFLNKEENKINIYTGLLVKEADILISFANTESSEDIDFIDITDDFCAQEEAWKAVWGEEGQIINAMNAQNILIDCHEKDKEFINKKSLDDNELILIHDKSKEFRSIALKTKCTTAQQNNDNFYRVKSEHIEKLQTIDFINWTKTVISFKSKVDWSSFEYTFSFSDPKKLKFISDDFKVYFILPEHYEIISESGRSTQQFWPEESKKSSPKDNQSTLEKIESTEDSSKIEDLKEPNVEVEKNALQEMKTDPDKYFKEWKDGNAESELNSGSEGENIEYRNYYKSSSFSVLKRTNKETKFEFKITSRKIKRASGWILTIIVSILIAFGLDHSRMSNPTINNFSILLPVIDYLFIIFAAVVTKICLQYTTDRKIEENKKLLRRFYRFALAFMFLWIFSLLLASSNYLFSLIKTFNQYIKFEFLNYTSVIRMYWYSSIILNLIVILAIFFKDKKLRKTTVAIVKIANGSKEYD